MSELERWNQRFSAADYIFGTEPNEFLASKAKLLRAGQRALCIADGEGRNSVWLAERGLEVVAFFSPAGVEKARRLAAERGVTVAFEVADVYSWKWPAGAFDVVVAIFVQFADPAMRGFMFERIVRALKPGGLLLLQGYTPRQLEYKTGGPPHVENLYMPELLRSAFAALEILEPDVGTARCDFPGGEARTLYRSVRRLLALPGETRLFMCHDYPPAGRDPQWQTTVAEQRARNIHISDGVSEDEFVAMRTARDRTLDMPTLILPAIQVNIRAGELPPPEANGTSYLKIPLNAL